MAGKELPKVGDRIPIDKIHVSKTNMRYGQPFPQDEEDEMLIANLRARRKEKERVTELVSLRPEGDGYGAYKGSRRFQAMKLAGYKELVVGQDCIIRNVSDEEAADSSWIENLEFLRKKVDPVLRAKKLSERIAFSTLSLRQLARRDGVAPSTYSEWLKVLDLTPKMQRAVSKGALFYTDALNVARMNLGEEKQEELASVLEEEGLEAFQREVARIPTGSLKRGVPPGVYELDRLMWDKRNKKEMDPYETITKVAKAKGMKRPDYIKDYLIRHIQEIAKETA